MSTLLAFYGGTFDPIHYGHLKSAYALIQLIGLKKIIFMPNNIPPHRTQPKASPKQRLDMINLAISEMPKGIFTADDYELKNNSIPSWTVETFENQRIKYGLTISIGLIIGQDSFLTFPKWYRSRDLLNLCHILVCTRPGYPNIQFCSQTKWLADRMTNNPLDLFNKPAGLIYYATTTKLKISSSEIRNRYYIGQSCKSLLPESVNHYIQYTRLYR
ncbi:nicotinate-nucleotide adenylyltransferase [Candidatus Schneideria nysicola]|uniref:nicotinate-nucleotide adenylyltransferase n=1 Tax=Candidatus Schneideria nysicola TaxID=1081631 RepID=UPI001CAA628D|nr:nicotinate-nucleotide adenylyltransferase [Candidatus Schneideria nysicola]UAJ64851.1 nicotinate-nucleotide adenylyltransferase [Candidatus Schneideria nysicola]